ncbi:MAG: gas vesicle protein [Acidimicrobiaceae bacterium]|nr:gas vesicle protein [Acidimicrobiaceae bacterium]
MSAFVAAEAGLRHLGELTSKQPIGVASIELSEDGWVVGVEVVEERRIPSSTDVLAVYEAQVGDSGDLVAFRRVKRYARCQVDPATAPDQQGPGDE